MSENTFYDAPDPISNEFNNTLSYSTFGVYNKTTIYEIDDTFIPLKSKAEKLFFHEYLVRRRRSQIISSLERKERERKHSMIRMPNGKLVPVSDSFKEKLEIVLQKFCYSRV